MPRPKGSKNKVTMIATASVDYAALIDEKQSAKDSLNAEVTSIAANIDSLKADLKSKKAEIKKLDKELAHLAEKKDEADKKGIIIMNKPDFPTAGRPGVLNVHEKSIAIDCVLAYTMSERRKV